MSELASGATAGFPLAPAYRWPTTGLGLPAAGFLGAPGEFLIGPRRADAGTDERDGARQGMAPEQRVGHRIQHHRRPMVPISRFSSTRICLFSRILDWPAVVSTTTGAMRLLRILVPFLAAVVVLTACGSGGSKKSSATTAVP